MIATILAIALTLLKDTHSLADDSLLRLKDKSKQAAKDGNETGNSGDEIETRFIRLATQIRSPSWYGTIRNYATYLDLRSDPYYRNYRQIPPLGQTTFRFFQTTTEASFPRDTVIAIEDQFNLDFSANQFKVLPVNRVHIIRSNAKKLDEVTSAALLLNCYVRHSMKPKNRGLTFCNLNDPNLASAYDIMKLALHPPHGVFTFSLPSLPNSKSRSGQACTALVSVLEKINSELKVQSKIGCTTTLSDRANSIMNFSIEEGTLPEVESEFQVVITAEPTNITRAFPEQEIEIRFSQRLVGVDEFELQALVAKYLLFLGTSGKSTYDFTTRSLRVHWEEFIETTSGQGAKVDNPELLTTPESVYIKGQELVHQALERAEKMELKRHFPADLKVWLNESVSGKKRITLLKERASNVTFEWQDAPCTTGPDGASRSLCYVGHDSIKGISKYRIQASREENRTTSPIEAGALLIHELSHSLDDPTEHEELSRRGMELLLYFYPIAPRWTNEPYINDGFIFDSNAKDLMAFFESFAASTGKKIRIKEFHTEHQTFTRVTLLGPAYQKGIVPFHFSVNAMSLGGAIRSDLYRFEDSFEFIATRVWETTGYYAKLNQCGERDLFGLPAATSVFHRNQEIPFLICFGSTLAPQTVGIALFSFLGNLLYPTHLVYEGTIQPLELDNLIFR